MAQLLAGTRTASSDEAMAEGSVDAMARRTHDLCDELGELASRLEATAVRLMGHPPSSGEVSAKPVAEAVPNSSLDRCDQALVRLGRIGARINDVTSRLSHL